MSPTFAPPAHLKVPKQGSLVLPMFSPTNKDEVNKGAPGLRITVVDVGVGVDPAEGVDSNAVKVGLELL